MEDQDNRTKKETAQWAIVNLFGHDRIAGKISEHSLGGGHFVRIDVPEIPKEAPHVGDFRSERPSMAGFTRLIGPNAVYSIDFVDEHTARLAASEIRAAPVQEYSIRQALERLGVVPNQLSMSPDD